MNRRLFLLWHTLRYLKPQQISWRLYYRLMRRRVKEQALVALGSISRRKWTDSWMAPTWMPSCQTGPNEFVFLGEHGLLNSPEDWNHSGKSKLWLYNLHYLDELCANSSKERFTVHRELVQRWIDENPALTGNGWEPYTLSLRLVNLVKWLSGPSRQRDEVVPEGWLASLARQAQALSAQREYHILGNHLFANGKALTFVGAFLQGDDAERWLRQGLMILDAEIPEQFLEDGGHFERSPMYHASLLWDLSDLVHLAKCTGHAELVERAEVWRQVLIKGLAWLKMMSHPDGEISFFNDATFGIAPSPADLCRYADFLGLEYQPEDASKVEPAEEGFRVCHAVPSGYVSVGWEEGNRVLIDLAPVGPDYQPGHAHADTLSFELSLFGQRVIVNSGISQYGEDSERHRQRSTAAHNTVVVDGESSSEVWAGFRVARRARPRPVQIDTDSSGTTTISGSHDGYLRLPGRVEHHREWCFEYGQMTIIDRLKGRYRSAEARFHCHPAVSVVLKGENQAEAILPDGQRLVITIHGGNSKLEATTWHPGFGLSHPNICLVVTLTGAECTTTVRWA